MTAQEHEFLDYVQSGAVSAGKPFGWPKFLPGGKHLLYVNMEGNEVFKHAVRSMEEAAVKALDANGLSQTDISLFIPHQANRRIIDATAKRLGVGSDRLFTNLHRYGNTSSASIPIALDEANHQGILKSGDKILLVAFGGGFAYGSALVEW